MTMEDASTTKRISNRLGSETIPSGITAKIPAATHVRGSILLVLAQSGTMVASFAMHFVLARLIVPAEYGAFNLVYSAFSIVVLLVSAGVPPAVSRLVAGRPEMSAATLRTGLLLQLSLSAIAVLIYGGGASVLGRLLSDAHLESLIRFSAAGIPAYALMYLYNGYLGGVGRFTAQAIATTVFSTSKIFFVAGLAIVWSSTGAVIGLTASAVSAAVFGVASSYHSHSSRHSPALIRLLLLQAMPLTILSLVLQALLSMDLFILKSVLVDDSTVAVYSAASTVARAPYFALTALWFVLLPSASRAAANRDEKRIASMTTQVIRLVAVAGFPVVSLATNVAEEIMVFLYPSTYASASQVMPALACAACLLALYCVLSGIWSGANGATTPAIVGTVAAILALPIGLHLTSAYGTQGAAASSLLSALACGVLMLGLTVHRYSAQLPYLSIARSIGAAMIAGWIASVAIATSGMLVIAVTMWALTYVVVLPLLGELGSDERAAIFCRIRRLARGRHEGRQ